MPARHAPTTSEGVAGEGVEVEAGLLQHEVSPARAFAGSPFVRRAGFMLLAGAAAIVAVGRGKLFAGPNKVHDLSDPSQLHISNRCEEPAPLNGKWGLYMKPWCRAPVFAEEICMRNVGGFAMQFNLWDTFTNRVTHRSPTISAQRVACLRVDDGLRNLEEDHPIAPRVFVKGFADSFVEPALQSVRYKANAGIAHYTCLGSTTSWYCNLETVGEKSGGGGGGDDDEDDGGSGLVEESWSRHSERSGNWNPLAKEWSLLPVRASEICVRDVGGYVMNFNLWDTYTNLISPTSGTISAQRTACIDISSIQSATKDHPISPRIFAHGWADSFTQVAIQSVLYDPEAGKAEYTCLGSTTSWYCNLDTVGSPP